jgi:hypothetical protein
MVALSLGIPMPGYGDLSFAISFLLVATCYCSLGSDPITQQDIFALELRNIAFPVHFAIVGKLALWLSLSKPKLRETLCAGQHSEKH